MTTTTFDPSFNPAFDPASAPGPRDRRILLQLIRRLSLKRGHFVLASGAESDYYLDLRLTTTDPQGAFLAARFLLHQAARLQVNRIGGPTLGADPLVGAAVALCAQREPSLRGFLVRSQAKDHGTGRLIEGHLEPGDRVLVLDDVVTAGGSILHACAAVRAAGATVEGSFCLVDRGQGGREKLAADGAPLTAVFPVEEVLREDQAGVEELTHPSSGSLESQTVQTAHRWPETPLLTVDAILELTPGQVLLVKRRNPPFGWALPGGFVEPGESAEQAVRREILEETGLVIERALQMQTYSAPGRDPRMSTASVVFVARAHGIPRAGDDAAETRSFPLDALPQNLCFDHAEVCADFRSGRFGIGPGQVP